MPGFRISIDTSSLHRGAENARRDMDQLTIAARNTQQGMRGIGSASAEAAAKMGLFTKAAAAAAAALAVKAVAAAGEYEHALWNMRKVTDESISSIKKRIESLPASLGNVTDLAKGYYQVLSAGVTDSAKAMETLKTASKLAAVAEVGQSDAIRALTKMMAGFGGEIKDVTTAAETLLDIEKYGQTSVAELVPVIGDISSVARLAGVSYKEMAAGLAVVTQTAGSTAQATTQLQALFTALIKPSEKLGQIINSLGAKSGAELVQKNGLAGALSLIAQAAEKANVSMGELLGSTEGIKAAAALSNGEFAAFYQTLAGVGSRAGDLEKNFESYQHTFTGLWNTIKNSLLDIGNTFAMQLVPSSKEGMEGLQVALDSLKSVAEGVGAVVGQIASFVAGIVRGIHSMLQGLKAAYAAQAEIAQEERAFVAERSKGWYGFTRENYMQDYFPELEAKRKAAAEAAAKKAAGGNASPAASAAPKPNLPTLSKNFKAPSFGGSGGGSRKRGGSGRTSRSRSSRSGASGSGGASSAEFALQRIQELREAVQELNGEVSGNALDKKLREIEQAGQKAKLPLKEIAQLKEDYTKAFQGSVLRDFNKALLEVTGSAKEIRAAKIEETVEEWRKKFVEAKIPAEEFAAKLAELRAGLEKKAGLEDLAEATDWLSGLRRSMENMAKDSQDWGRKVEDLWISAADSMTDAFVTFCTTGKNNFKDMANSIISDIIRMITKAMIIQPLMNALGKGISGMFTGGSGGMAKVDMFDTSGELLALGGIRSGGTLAAYANSIVAKPTLFSYDSVTPFAKGGVMGEAGPEAVMPLTRMSNGKLGVQSGGAGTMQLQLTIVDKTSGGVGVQDAQAQQNGMSIDMMINQIEQGIVRRASSGRSPLMNFIDKTRGTSNARRLY